MFKPTESSEGRTEQEDNPEQMKEKIKKALEIAMKDGSVEGDHHKAWVIDQMIRALTGCPPAIIKKAINSSGQPYEYKNFGESDEYRKFVSEHKKNESDWDEGIAP